MYFYELHLKGLSNEKDFKIVDNNLQYLAYR